MAASSTWFEAAYTWRYLLVVLVLVHGVVLQQPQQLVVFGQQQQLPWNQVQALMQLQKLLEYPSAMASWSYNSNFCSITRTPSLNITCSASSSSAGTSTLTYLRVVGDKIPVPIVDRLHITTTLEAAAAAAQGPAAPQQQNINYNSSISLASYFNFSALVQTLFSFPELQGIELVSVGLWGNLPNFFSNQLPNLQVLNASSNLISGSPLPPSLSPPGLQALRVLALDRNALTGGFPSSSQLRSLQVLSLSENQLSGELTNNDITSLQSLVSLSLAHNQFTGLLPSFESLVNLQSLNVGGNSFGPSFPASLGTMLVSLYLGENQLAGAIPSSLKSLTKLQTLDVSGNALSGNPPAFLFQLPSIVSLNLARNHLSGNLPYSLSLAPSLVFLDLSSNLLSGALPQAFLLSSSTANNQAPHAVTIKYQNNCLNTTKQQQETAQYCSSQTAEFAGGAGGPIVHHHISHQHMAFIAAIVGGSVVIGMAMCLLAMLLFKRWSSCEDDCSVVAADHYDAGNSSFANSIGIPSELLFNARYISQSKRLGVLPQPLSRTFTLEELKEATNDFSPAALVGEGSHGKVFKGLLADRTQVAVKWVAMKANTDMQEIKMQLDDLCKLRHRHLVTVLGYCIDDIFAAGDEDAHDNNKSESLFIVSEYVERGDLRSLLAKKGDRYPLTWSERLAAAIGAGRGIHHLHSGVVPPVFDNNLKITSILLGESMDAQVSDFGILGHLSSFAVNTNTQEAKQAGVHFKEDLLTSRKEQSDKQDIYDYGLILLEMVLGRPPTIRNPFPQKRSELERLTKEKGPSMELIDKAIVGMCGAESLATVLEIAGKCMVDNPARRPSMEDVLWNLQYAAQVHTTSAELADEFDARREEFQKAPSSGDRRRGGGGGG
ncbi:hypothetical protein CY35_15G068400, partial [Sphagnum magellanicum]